MTSSSLNLSQSVPHAVHRHPTKPSLCLHFPTKYSNSCLSYVFCEMSSFRLLCPNEFVSLSFCICLLTYLYGQLVIYPLIPYSNIWAHGLRTPREEMTFTARPKIKSQSQIFRYGRSIFWSATSAQFFRFLWFMLSLGVSKVIIEKSRGEVSPMGQDTIENVS